MNVKQRSNVTFVGRITIIRRQESVHIILKKLELWRESFFKHLKCLKLRYFYTLQALQTL
ncbi:MAG: hypothetical protein C4531_00870 [Desulfurivibrio sp.]|nr:MAG: hypothetical protein C4531_00870 [Desulfurivibrio sp.]